MGRTKLGLHLTLLWSLPLPEVSHTSFVGADLKNNCFCVKLQRLDQLSAANGYLITYEELAGLPAHCNTRPNIG